MQEELAKWLRQTIEVKSYPIADLEFKVERPDDFSHGDYATNLALVLGRKLDRNPLDLAKELADILNNSCPDYLAMVTVLPPGFINFTLAPEFVTKELEKLISANDQLELKKEQTDTRRVIVEYTDPNPFKEFHVGHLMSNTIGEAIARLTESTGATVTRVCYQGDVGLHVAKAIWGKIKGETDPYVAGSLAYESSDRAKNEINELNKKIYDRSDDSVNHLYDEGRQASLDKFEKIYRRLGTKFDDYFFESETGKVGQKIVEENIGKVFEKSNDAIVFQGEKYDQKLHTRVFLTAEGLPTYEAKELGLAKQKAERYSHELSIVITGNEVSAYFGVLRQVLTLIFPELAKKLIHLPHGMLRLPTGKMSSRTGQVVTAEALLSKIKEMIEPTLTERDFSREERERVAEAVVVGAAKYSILKQSPGRDVIFDLEKSIAIDGDSGPYLQYAYVRARAVLEKGKAEGILPNLEKAPSHLSRLERTLIHFPEVVARATATYAPNLVVTYLTELASTFNSYYASQKIVDPEDASSAYHLAVTSAFAQVMKLGLQLLAIPIPEKM